MCGIAGYSLSKGVRINSKRISKEMLLAIEHRGHDAAGFAFRDSTGAFQIHKANMTASQFVKRNLCVPLRQRTVIMHTRFATQGEPMFNVNNHPIAAGSVVGVHNGHISNDDRLFEAIERVTGYNVRVGEVDSEAAFAVLRYIDQPVMDSLEEISGGAVFVFMDKADTENVLHLARLSSSPLIVARTTDGSVFFASTSDAVLKGVHAAGLWVEDMIDVAEGEYFTVQHGVITSSRVFQPARSYYGNYRSNTSGGHTYVGGSHASGGGSGDWHDEYEWQNGRLVRDNDLHSIVEASKRGDGRSTAPGATGSGVASVTSLSERLAAEEPDAETEDDREALDEWFRLNAERIAELETSLGHGVNDVEDDNDETQALVAELRAKVRWNQYPMISTGLFDVEHFITTPGETEYLGDPRHAARSHAIEIFSQSMSDTAKAQSANLLKVFARPGDAVKCNIEQMEYVGHIVTVPETFPRGDYVLRVFALNGKRKCGHECVLVSKAYHEFEVIGSGVVLRTTADMSAALNKEEVNA